MYLMCFGEKSCETSVVGMQRVVDEGREEEWDGAES